MSLDWNKYPNFSSWEFEDGGPEMHPDFMKKLQIARNIADIPFNINSGSRSEDKNREVGGKPDSTHLHGRACDIDCDYSRNRFIMVSALIRAGFTRIGIGEGFIHVDDGELIDDKHGHPKDPQVIWLY